MKAQAESFPEMQSLTRPAFSSAQLNLDKLSGVERLDLSVAQPSPTRHLQFIPSAGASFQLTPHEAAWQLSARGNGLQLGLEMPGKHGVGLMLEMRRTAYNPADDQPVIFHVNGKEWPLALDPHHLSFQTQSWYLPHSYLHEGANVIGLRLAPEAKTDVLVKAVAVMRFELEPQRTDNWCWAAVTQSLLRFFNSNEKRTQCEIVRTCFNHPSQPGLKTAKDCCQEPRCEECNKGFKLMEALDILGIQSARCNYPLSLREIRAQLTLGVPIIVRIRWQGGGGHYVVITAIGPPPAAGKGEEETWLRVADPLDPSASYMTYRTLKGNQEWNWTHSFLFEKLREPHS